MSLINSVEDLPVETGLTRSNGDLEFGMVLGIGGAVVVLVCMLIMMFGPNELYILGGPDFFEFFLLYPGPIAALSGLVMMSGAKIINRAYIEWDERFFNHISSLKGEGFEVPNGYRLKPVLVWKKKGRACYRIELMKVD